MDWWCSQVPRLGRCYGVPHWDWVLERSGAGLDCRTGSAAERCRLVFLFRWQGNSDTQFNKNSDVKWSKWVTVGIKCTPTLLTWADVQNSSHGAVLGGLWVPAEAPVVRVDRGGGHGWFLEVVTVNFNPFQIEAFPKAGRHGPGEKRRRWESPPCLSSPQQGNSIKTDFHFTVFWRCEALTSSGRWEKWTPNDTMFSRTLIILSLTLCVSKSVPY